MPIEAKGITIHNVHNVKNIWLCYFIEYGYDKN